MNPKDTVDIAGVAVQVVSQEESEAAGMVVCVRYTGKEDSVFTDNVRGVCSKCQHAIYHRPTVPAKPRKFCMECFIGMLAEEKLMPEVVTNPQQLADLVAKAPELLDKGVVH